MKRIFAILLCLMLLWGCENQQAAENTTAFYYLATEQSYEAGDSFLRAELRQDISGTLEETLTIYLAGPVDDRYRSPFPAGLQIIGCHQEGNTFFVTFSKELASLTNLDLTLACSCIAMTCLELTGAEQITIDAQDSLLSGQKTITFDRASLYLADNCTQGE